MNELITVIDNERESFAKVAVVKSVEFDREKGFALQILGASEYLQKVALGNPASLGNAVHNVAAIGVSLNPASKLAYLVPRKINGVPAICLDISYMGLMHIAQDCEAIQWGQAVIVRKADKFQLREIGQQPAHEYSPFATDRGDIIGVYVVVKTDTGDFLTHAMPIAKVYDIRNRSDAWRAYERDKTKKNPWVTDEEEMIKKTCVKQAAKMWPRRERLDGAVHHMNTEGGEGISLKPNKMSEEELATWEEKILAADTKQAAKKAWQDAVKVCEPLGDVESAEKLKTLMLGHAAGLPDAVAKAA